MERMSLHEQRVHVATCDIISSPAASAQSKWAAKSRLAVTQAAKTTAKLSARFIRPVLGVGQCVARSRSTASGNNTVLVFGDLSGAVNLCNSGIYGVLKKLIRRISSEILPSVEGGVSE
jgi:hypothetical protein